MKTTIKVPWPNPSDSSFAAFPWNVHLVATYETVFKSLQNNKLFKNLTFKYGFNALPSNPKSIGIAEFINRNKQMYDIFVDGIKNSDIFIADITGHNPNVMLELGIAMKLNKNILILKEKGIKEEFPFDIQGVYIHEYDSIKNIEKTITDFIDMFSKIRNQTFDDYFPERYTKIEKINLEGTQSIVDPRFPKGIKNFLIRFNYRFIDYVNKNDWIGIHLRTQGPDRNNSELIYSRVNGRLETISWPSNKPPIKAKNKQPLGQDFLEVSIIGNRLDALTNSKSLDNHSVSADGFGIIMLYSQDHTPEEDLKGHKLQVEFTNIEIINLDTTSPL